MKSLFKKYFKSAYNFSIIKTLIFNVRYFRCLRPKIFLGKRTKFFIEDSTLEIKRNVYFDCRNSGQFWYDSSIVLEGKNSFAIGENVNFFSGAQIKLFKGSTLSIGDNTYFSGPIVLHSKKSIKIGSSCSISWNVTIIDSNFHAIGKNEEIISNPVVIGNNVWIGNNVIILKGVTIGNNSIIAAGSVVTKSIPDNEIYGGNPAKFMRKVN